MNDEVGDLYFIFGCSAKNMKIGKINKQIGIGPSMLLMTIKALFKFFLVLSIINLPTLFLYYNFYWFFGVRTHSNSTAAKTSSFDIFAKMSLGNVKKNLEAEMDYYRNRDDSGAQEVLNSQDTSPGANVYYYRGDNSGNGLHTVTWNNKFL